MPHVVVKIWPGKTEAQKQQLSKAIAKNVMDILGSKDASISVGIEEVDSEAWSQDVYLPDILGKWETLYKEPGYNPFE